MATRRSSLTIVLPIPTTPLQRQIAVGCTPLSPISRLSSLGSTASMDSEDTVDLARVHLIALLQHLRRQDLRLNKKMDKLRNSEELAAVAHKKGQIETRMKKTLELLELL